MAEDKDIFDGKDPFSINPDGVFKEMVYEDGDDGVQYNLGELFERQSEFPLSDTDFSQALKNLPRMTPEGPWLAGGSIRRLLQGARKIESDFDFFFASEKQFQEWCTAMGDLDSKVISTTEHNVTYKVSGLLIREKDDFIPGEGLVAEEVEETIELIVQGINFKYYDSPIAVIQSFDFTICQLAYDGEQVFAGPYTLWDIARKRLVLNKLTYGVSTMRRLLKYQNQGYFACSGTLTAILEAVGKNPKLIEADIKYID